jgi:hypothetical protein
MKIFLASVEREGNVGAVKTGVEAGNEASRLQFGSDQCSRFLPLALGNSTTGLGLTINRRAVGVKSCPSCTAEPWQLVESGLTTRHWVRATLKKIAPGLSPVYLLKTLGGTGGSEKGLGLGRAGVSRCK